MEPLPKITKYNLKEKTMYCPDCKTFEVMCDGEGSLSIPTGFGFLPGDHRFSIAGHKLTGYFGTCEHCRERIFNYRTRRAFKKYPKLKGI